MIEVSDGWYFLKATLDAELTEHLRQGRLRLGQHLHVCGAQATSFDVEDPLQLSPSARLHLSAFGVRPAKGAAGRRLGFQKAFSFPPSKITALPAGFAVIPNLDVVALRVLPADVHCMHQEVPWGTIEVLAVDSQTLARPSLRPWWNSLVKILLIGSNSLATESIQPLDRLRVSHLRQQTEESPRQVISGRSSSLQRQGAEEAWPKGIPRTEFCREVLGSPFGRGAPMFSSEVMPYPAHFRGHMCDLIGVPIMASLEGCFILLAPQQKLCRITLVSESEMHRGRLLPVWKELALKALSASESGQAPDALAVQNVTFLGLGHGEVVDFLATARQLEVSASPQEQRMQEAMDFAFFSPAEVQQAHAKIENAGCMRN